MALDFVVIAKCAARGWVGVMGLPLAVAMAAPIALQPQSPAPPMSSILFANGALCELRWFVGSDFCLFVWWCVSGGSAAFGFGCLVVFVFCRPCHGIVLLVLLFGVVDVVGEVRLSCCSGSLGLIQREGMSSLSVLPVCWPFVDGYRCGVGAVWLF